MAKKKKQTYRLKNFNADTYDELWTITYTKSKLWIYISLIFLLLAGFVYVVIAFTPIKKTIPGYPSDDIEAWVKHNTELIDSLERELNIKETRLNSLIDIIDKASGEYDTILNYEEIIPVYNPQTDTEPVAVSVDTVLQATPEPTDTTQ
ncbi:MAG: hypothetical protein Kow0068_08060 [Marinilabiliales bacterium]